MKNQHNLTAHYHLPGLFEFYELYSVFLPLFRKHREMFYTGATSARFTAHRLIVSGAAGRAGFGEADVRDVLALLSEYGISTPTLKTSRRVFLLCTRLRFFGMLRL